MTIRNIIQPILKPIVRAINEVYGFFNPISLFSSGEQGVWYDPSDISTLFQDSAGTTPVTAVEQPVGLMLDKSKGLVLGPELITVAADRDFSSNTGYWIGNGGVSIANGTFNWNNVPDTYAGYTVSNSITTPGKYYEITWTISSISAGGLKAGAGSNFGIVRTQPGTYTDRILAGSSSNRIIWLCSGTTTASIDNVSVKEVQGNHATQSTSTKRPVLSARYNLLTKTEQFDDAVWTKSGGWFAFGSGSVANVTAVTDPLGGNTADLLLENTTNSGHNITQSISYIAGFRYTASIYVKRTTGSSRYVWMYFPAGAFGAGQLANFDLSNGTYNVVAGSAATYTCTLLADGWAKISISATATNSVTLAAGFVGTAQTSASTTSTYTGDGTSGIYIWGADLRVANDGVGIPAYQRVNTSTDYDTVGFKPYLKFDGVDDALATNSIDFTAGDKMTVFAGVRRLLGGTLQMITEFSGAFGSYNGSFNVPCDYSGGSPYYLAFASKGTAASEANTNSAIYAPPLTSVITGIGNISVDQAILRVNGTQVASSASDQGTGNYGNYILYIGSRGGTQYYLNGCLTSLIIRAAQSTDAQIASAERWVNQRTGAY